MSKFMIKEGNTGREMVMFLKDGNGDPVNLDKAMNVKVRIAKYKETISERNADIDNREKAKIVYKLKEQDIPYPREFSVEVDVTYTDGSRLTFPTGSEATLVVEPKSGS